MGPSIDAVRMTYDEYVIGLHVDMDIVWNKLTENITKHNTLCVSKTHLRHFSWHMKNNVNVSCSLFL